MAVKLLKGKVECPKDPADPLFDAFDGNPEDSSDLLAADAVAMTQTYADTSMVEFTVDQGLRKWLANIGVASICMTQVGLPDSSACWEEGRCTALLGRMRWTGKNL